MITTMRNHLNDDQSPINERNAYFSSLIQLPNGGVNPDISKTNLLLSGMNELTDRSHLNPAVQVQKEPEAP